MNSYGSVKNRYMVKTKGREYWRDKKLFVHLVMGADVEKKSMVGRNWIVNDTNIAGNRESSLAMSRTSECMIAKEGMIWIGTEHAYTIVCSDYEV